MEVDLFMIRYVLFIDNIKLSELLVFVKSSYIENKVIEIIFCIGS